MYVTVLKIDIPDLTDLDSHILKSLKGPCYGWMHVRLVFMRSRAGFSVRQHSFVEMGHEIISTAILSLALIQVGQLSVTGERMCT